MPGFNLFGTTHKVSRDYSSDTLFEAAGISVENP